MERSGLSRSVAMQLTGHKTEAVYRRYAITSEADLREGVARLNAGPLAATGTPGTKQGTIEGGWHRLTLHEAQDVRQTATPGWRNWQTHRT